MTHPMTLIDDGSLNGLQHITFAIASEIPIFVVCLFVVVFFFFFFISQNAFPGRFVLSVLLLLPRTNSSCESLCSKWPRLIFHLDDDRLILTSRASTHACTAALSRIKNAKKSGRVQTLVSLERLLLCVLLLKYSLRRRQTPQWDLLKVPSFFVLCCLGFEKLSKFRVLKIQREKKREEN